MLQAFEDAPPTKMLSTLFGVHPPSLLIRRMAHEKAVHRWDTENAVGAPGVFDHALAGDGIDEVLGLWVPMAFKYAEFAGVGRAIRLHAIDGDDGWLITVNAETTEWRRGHEEGVDVTARGALSDLYLFIWNRRSADQLDVLGDMDLLTRWQAAAIV